MKKYLSVILMLGLLFIVANPSFATSRYGTKAYGMGGAFTAIADDASAVYWNPAGLTQNSLVGLQVSGGGQMDQEDIEDIADFIDKVEELSNSNLSSNEMAAELEKLNLPNDTAANINGIAALNLNNVGLAGIFNSNFKFRGDRTSYNGYDIPKGTATNYLTGQGILGLGTKVIDPPIVGSLSVGLSGKYLYARNDEAETVVNNGELETTYKENDDNGLGADIGMLATLTDTDVLNVKAGATMKNIINTMDMEPEALEKTTTIGAGATFKFPLIELLSTRLAADLEMPEHGADIRRFGFEGTIGMFSIRAGTYNSDDMKEAVNTGGIGLNLPFVDFNLTMDSEDYISASGTFNF